MFGQVFFCFVFNISQKQKIYNFLLNLLREMLFIVALKVHCVTTNKKNKIHTYFMTVFAVVEKVKAVE